MVKDQNEFNKKSKRNKSQEFIKESYNALYGEDFGNVIETEEEENSDSSHEDYAKVNKTQNKTYSIGYLTKTIRTKKIYSDDFDADFDLFKANQELKFKIASAVNSAI